MAGGINYLKEERRGSDDLKGSLLNRVKMPREIGHPTTSVS